MPPARDPAEALLTARDVDGIEAEPSTPEDAQLLERVRMDRARQNRRRRSVVIAVAAFLVLAAALAVAMRTPRVPHVVTASAPADVPATGPAPAPAPASETPRGAQATAPTPRPTDEPTLPSRGDSRPPPPRASRTTPPAAAARAVERPDVPAAMPSAVAPRPPMRVQITQSPGGDGAVDYRVRVTRPDGTPVTDAAVRLRGVMNDGGVVEAHLEAGNEPGVYQSFLAFSPRGPRRLTLRVAGADGILEMPVADPAP